jgi:hypothetical protein
MLSLLKKKSEAAAAPAVPNWHPNFRNYEKLPDIKVVRTAFFVNGAAIFVALALGIYFGFNEWQLRQVRTQKDEAESRIARDKAGSDQAVATFNKFKAEEAKIVEVDTFVKSRPLVSPLIHHLGATLPPNIAFDSLELREAGLLLRLSVRGTPDVASGYATAYKDLLQADKVLAENFGEPSFGAFEENPATGRLSVTINLPAKSAKK